MSSVFEESSNDVTSTNNTSFPSSSDGHGDIDAHTLTTTAITRECIKQGFYRTPVCNDILYLHHRGYSNIAPTAFEPYTEVKVLWLEGNGLSSIACGAPYIQIRPPVRIDLYDDKDSPSSDSASRSSAKEQGEDACRRPVVKEDDDTSVHALSCHVQEKNALHADPCVLVDAMGCGGNECATQESATRVRVCSTAVRSATLPRAASVPESCRDVFSSLYPTLRQLYLHNNIFQHMPDFSRFEQLDSVNLSNNFITTVRCYCSCGDTVRESSPTVTHRSSDTPTDCAQPHRVQGPAACEATSQTSATATESAAVTESVPKVVDVATASQQRREELLALTERVRRIEALRAPHRTPVHLVGISVTQAHDAPLTQRGPCHTLRTLNLSANQLSHFDDVVELLCYRALSVLDLSKNELQDGEALLLILERMPELRCLKLMGNPLVRQLPRYRKTVLSRCTRLTYLDDRPVFEEERRLVAAWTQHGERGEAAERECIRAEKAEVERRRLDSFRRLTGQHRDGPHAATIDAVDHVHGAVHKAQDDGSPQCQAQTGNTADAKRKANAGAMGLTTESTMTTLSLTSSTTSSSSRRSSVAAASRCSSSSCCTGTKKDGDGAAVAARAHGENAPGGQRTERASAAALDSDDMDDVYIPEVCASNTCQVVCTAHDEE